MTVFRDITFLAAGPQVNAVVRQQTTDLRREIQMRLTRMIFGCAFALVTSFNQSANAQETLLTGPIKDLRPQKMPTTILLEGYRVHLTKDTKIVFSDAGKATVADLKVAQKVSCRSTSEIRLTNPPQIDADEIVIQGGKNAEAKESVTGPVKEVRTQGMPIKGATKDVIANILVDGYSIHITKETTILFSDARKATVADLKVGQRVSARMASDIADTDPPQIHTDVIVIQVGAEEPKKQKR